MLLMLFSYSKKISCLGVSLAEYLRLADCRALGNGGGSDL